MVESLREFKITFYMDSNKRTIEKEFDLDDYREVAELLDEVEMLIKDIRNEGILEIL